MEQNPYEPPQEVNEPKRSTLISLLLLIGAVPAGFICFGVTCTGSEFGAIAIGIPFPGIIPVVIGLICGLSSWWYLSRLPRDNDRNADLRTQTLSERSKRKTARRPNPKS